MVLVQQVIEIIAVDLGGVENDRGVLGIGVFLGGLATLVGIDVAVDGGGVDLAVLQLHPLDLVLPDQVGQGAEIHLEAGGLVGGVAGVGGKIVKPDGQHHGPGQQHQHPPEVAPVLVVFTVLVVIRIHRGLLPYEKLLAEYGYIYWKYIIESKIKQGRKNLRRVKFL